MCERNGGNRPGHLYMLKISEDESEVTQIDVTVKAADMGQEVTYEHKLYIYDDAGSSWTVLDTHDLGDTKTSFSGSITSGCADYVNASGDSGQGGIVPR